MLNATTPNESGWHVKAHFMHKHQEDAAQEAVASSVISSAEWTPRYVMSIGGKTGIASLTQQGLEISPNRPSSRDCGPAAPGRRRQRRVRRLAKPADSPHRPRRLADALRVWTAARRPHQKESCHFGTGRHMRLQISVTK